MAKKFFYKDENRKLENFKKNIEFHLFEKVVDMHSIAPWITP